MDIEEKRESISIRKMVVEKKELIFVEEDMIVPDSKPDILNAINLSGNVCILKKELQNGKIKIDGNVNTYIMYLPDSREDNVRGLNAIIDFSKVIPIEECKEEMDANVTIEIKDMECKVINGRKINVKVGLEFKISIYLNESIDIITELNNIESIQTLEENLSVNSFVGKSSTIVYIKDTVNVDEENEIAEILKVNVKLMDTDAKISYNKVLSKCEAEVKILYLTEDNKINKVKCKIPAVGFIDMQNVSEENSCKIENEIKNITIRPNSAEEHSIYVEIELETSCIVFARKDIMLIQDLYSPVKDIQFSQRKINALKEKIGESNNFTVTSKINLQELEDGNLIDTDITPMINKKEILSSKINYDGELIVRFIFINASNNISSRQSKIPFSISVENPINDENISLYTELDVLNKKIDVKPNGDADCSIDMEIQTEVMQNATINIIDNIEINENDADSGDYDSLIIYVVQKGDTLWKIAKRFRTTIDIISRLNGIEDSSIINIGQKIYIPKFNYNSVKKEQNNELSA